jgi:hypothetical protein
MDGGNGRIEGSGGVKDDASETDSWQRLREESGERDGPMM